MALGVAEDDIYIPSPRTYESLKRDVLNYIQGTQDDTDLDSLAGRAINDGIDRINSRTWKKIVEKMDITTVADDDDYPLLLTVKEPMVLLELDSSSNRQGRLEFKDLKSFYTERPNATVSGTPSHYTIQPHQRMLLLDVPASSGYVSQVPTLQFWYFRRIPHLTDEANKLDIPPEFERLVINHAAAMLAAIRGHQVFNFVRQEEELAWRELIRDDNEVQTDWSEC